MVRRDKHSVKMAWVKMVQESIMPPIMLVDACFFRSFPWRLPSLEDDHLCQIRVLP